MNTFFMKKNESYQRRRVSILKNSILTFVLLKKVYRNKNWHPENWNEMFRKGPDRKSIENDYCLICGKVEKPSEIVKNFVGYFLCGSDILFGKSSTGFRNRISF